MTALGNFSLKLFGNLITPYMGYFDSLKTNLRKGKMDMLVEEYVSTVLLASLITFMGALTMGSIFLSMVTMAALYAFTLSIIIAFGAAGLVFFLGYYYPTLQAAGVKKEIDKSLPFASFYMATTSSSGINPVDIFKVLSLRKGAIGEEAKRIHTNVKTLGSTLPAALQKTAARSPSPDFADLLWGMISVITAGGDLESYLRNKTTTLMTKYRRALNDYAKAITLYTEIYITLVIVGSLFFIILISIMSPMTGVSTLLLQTFLVFFFVPCVSIAYIVLLKSISPTE